MIVPVEVDAAALELLVGTRWLREDQAEDRKAIGCAIAALLCDAAAHR
jgi:hypothetical protein